MKYKINRVKEYLKNIKGWKTKHKLVVISVDDYGNVRISSKKAREALDKLGINKSDSRFDRFDALETKQDLEMLFDVLHSVRDKNGKPAILTLFAVPCNIDFEKVIQENYDKYYYEMLPETYSKLSTFDSIVYQGAWELWKEGIRIGLLEPQFHGREHINLKVFNEKVKAKDYEVINNLLNRSYTSISSSGYPTINVYASFDFWKYNENEHFNEIIKNGLKCFKDVFGYSPIYFNPPAGSGHPAIFSILKENKVDYIDTQIIKKFHIGEGQYKTTFQYTGCNNNYKQTYIVRNVVFEPTDNYNVNSVELALKQIEIAFTLNRPAIISSHRVNYSGYIDPNNRKKGLEDLKILLNKIIRKWPDVEFISGSKLGKLINNIIE